MNKNMSFSLVTSVVTCLFKGSRDGGCHQAVPLDTKPENHATSEILALKTRTPGNAVKMQAGWTRAI